MPKYGTYKAETNDLVCDRVEQLFGNIVGNDRIIYLTAL